MLTVQELQEKDLKNPYDDLLKHVLPTDVLHFTHEAHFHLSVTVNKQNFRYWYDNNPQELHQRPLHDPQVTVVCRF